MLIKLCCLSSHATSSGENKRGKRHIQLSSALCVVSSSYVLETLCVYIVVLRLSLLTKCHHCVSMCNSRIVFLTVFVLNPASVLFLIDCLSEVLLAREWDKY